MLSRNDILETIRMIDQQHLDIRTITMGISLLSCADSSAERACEKIYDKISRYAEHLVATGEEIEQESVSYTHLDVYKRQVRHDGDLLAHKGVRQAGFADVRPSADSDHSGFRFVHDR